MILMAYGGQDGKQATRDEIAWRMGVKWPQLSTDAQAVVDKAIAENHDSAEAAMMEALRLFHLRSVDLDRWDAAERLARLVIEVQSGKDVPDVLAAMVAEARAVLGEK